MNTRKRGRRPIADALPDKDRIETLEAIAATWLEFAPGAFLNPNHYAWKLRSRIAKAHAEIVAGLKANETRT